MKTTETGRKKIEAREGCKLKAYPDPATGGKPWTIGYGHTGPEVHQGMVITQGMADQMLDKDLAKWEALITSVIHRSMLPYEFDALVSLAHNIGDKNFASSSVVRQFNAGNKTAAADAFLMWKNAPGHPGMLLGRRQDERKQFLGG